MPLQESPGRPLRCRSKSATNSCHRLRGPGAGLQDSGSGSGAELRRLLGRAVNALGGLSEAYTAAITDAGLQPAQQHRAFLQVLDRDCRDALAAMELVLAQPAISSQLVDNLNASIHLRALLTDLFLLDEIAKLHEAVAMIALFRPNSHNAGSLMKLSQRKFGMERISLYRCHSTWQPVRRPATRFERFNRAGKLLGFMAVCACLMCGCRSPSKFTPGQASLGWRPVASWSGHANYQTDSFNMGTGQWRIKWQASDQPSSKGGTFRVIVHSSISGRFVMVAVDHAGAGNGVAYASGGSAPVLPGGGIERFGLERGRRRGHPRRAIAEPCGKLEPSWADGRHGILFSWDRRSVTTSAGSTGCGLYLQPAQTMSPRQTG